MMHWYIPKILQIYRKTFLVCLLGFLLNGCGFHLRGFVDLPKWFDNVAVIAQDQHRNLVLILKNQLDINQIHLSPDPARADYWLIIEDEIFQQHIAGISSSTTPRQYQLIYTVLFKVQKSRGEEVISVSKVTVSRQITINNDRILGSDYEETLTKNEMRREAVSQILSRISKKQQYRASP